MKNILQILFLIIISCIFNPGISYATLPPPYDTAPYTIDLSGNSAQRDSGGFFQKPEYGYTSLIVWLGTNITPGSLTMYFSDPFFDGEGYDFAIRTSSESWGHLADTALFEFYMDDILKGSFSSSLNPDSLFEFDLPGNSTIANRIIVTNITPDPPGINGDGTMAFIDAGVAHIVPEPISSVLFVTGGATLAVRRYLKRKKKA